MPWHMYLIRWLIYIVQISTNIGLMHITARQNENFLFVLEKSQYGSKSSDPVKFSVSIKGYPDMPPWMKLEQQSVHTEAFLYGTPTDDDIPTSGSINVIVTSWNKNTYDTEQQQIIVSIEKSSRLIHQIEFRILNKQLCELLVQDQNNFLLTLKRQWPEVEFVTYIGESQFKGDSSPFAQNQGVYIAVGSCSPIPSALSSLKDSCHDVSNAIANALSRAGYRVDWCSLRVISNVTSTTSQNENDEFDAITDDFTTPEGVIRSTFDASPQTTAGDIVYAFIPVIVGSMLVILLTYVMCCRRSNNVVRRQRLSGGEKIAFQQQMELCDLSLRKVNTDSNQHVDTDIYGEMNDQYANYMLDRNSSTLPSDRVVDRTPRHERTWSPMSDNVTAKPPHYRIPPNVYVQS